MRLALWLCCLALLGLCPLAAGCGGASSASRTQAGQALRSLRGDEDDDDGESHTMGSRGVSNADSDNDSDNDAADNARNGYYDGDDGIVEGYGHAAGASEARALAAIAERYHAAAAAENGAAACSMVTASLSSSAVEDYAAPLGPAYLHGAKTCAAVLTRVFAHEHAKLSAPVQVTRVRVDGGRALVLLGSHSTPASYLIMLRQGGVPRITNMLPEALP